MTIRRVAALSAVLVALIFSGLTLQMSRGGDPAIGTDARAEATDAASSQPTSDDAYEYEGEDDEDDDGFGGVVVQQPAAPAPTPVQTSTS